MAIVPVREMAEAASTETLEERFRRLERTWMSAVGHFSSPSLLCDHPAFQEILSLGKGVVPLMLRDLEERPRLWVYALPQITGLNPVPEADRGNIRKMTEAWLRWSKESGSQ